MVVARNPELREVGKILRKEFLSFHWLIHFLIAATIPWWISPAIYLYLRWFLFDQHGILAWVLVVGLTLCFFASVAFMIASMIRLSKPVKEARKRVNNSERGAEQDLIEARENVRQNFSMRPLGLGFMCLFLMIPSAVSLLLLNSIQDVQIRSPHHTVDLSLRAELLRSIKSWEHRGIFTPLTSD